MLVLARRLNERIVIPCIQAAIQIVGIQGGIVRLGIEAPHDVKVFREEVLGPDAADGSGGDAPAKQELNRRLADAAHELAVLRRQLRGTIPANAADTLFRIDRELTDLAHKVNGPTTGTTITVSAAV